MLSENRQTQNVHIAWVHLDGTGRTKSMVIEIRKNAYTWGTERTQGNFWCDRNIL